MNYDECANELFGQYKYNHVDNILYNRELTTEEYEQHYICGEDGNCEEDKVGCKGNENCSSRHEDYEKLEEELHHSDWRECSYDLKNNIIRYE